MSMDLVSIIISLIALVVSIMGIIRVRTDAVKEFSYKIDSREEKENRRIVYQYRQQFPDNDAYLNHLKNNPEELSQSIALFEYWARLVRHHYLPFWAFKGMPGQVAVNFYKFVEPYINFRRNVGYPDINNSLNEDCKNKNFADNYEWLVKKIDKKKYQYKN